MMKAARRKLKNLWSRKKKKKHKSHSHHHQPLPPPEYHLPPPPNYHYRYTSCSSSVQIQPSAPPLPPSCLDAPPQPGPDGGIIEYSYSFLRQFEMHQQGAEADDDQQEITVENYYTTSPVAAAYSDESQQQGITTYYDNEDALLYQKYLVPDPPRPPVYGVPTVTAPPPLIIEKTQTISGVLLDCVVKLGASLFPCFCPCFHIREARRR